MNRDWSKPFLWSSVVLFAIVYPLWLSMVNPREVIAGVIQAVIPAVVPAANKIGNSSKFQLGTGTSTNGDCAAFDSNGNIVDAGVGGCTGSSGGSTAFSALTSATNTTAAMVVGTSASLNYTATGTINASSLQGVSGLQGNGSLVQLSTGSTTTNHCVKFDASGNTVDAGGACGSGTSQFVLLQTLSASNSATLDFASWYSSTYDVYELELFDFFPASNSVNLLIRFSTNGGSSYDSGSNYVWSGNRASTNPTNTAASGNTDTAIKLDTGGGFVNTGNAAVNGRFRLWNPGGTTYWKSLTGESVVSFQTSGFASSTSTVGGYYESTSAVNAFRLLMSSGNISTGTCRVYGLAH